MKTRLAESIGHPQALAVYQKLLAHTQAVAEPLTCDKQVWYSSFITEDDRWREYEKRLQSGDDLGDRMAGAFREAFAEGYRYAVVIGSDCAELTPAIIRQAFRELSDHKVVLGPSQDGGYYLLGMSSYYGDLFAGIDWSTPSVLQQTIGRVKRQKLSYTLLPTLNDIDTEQDLRQSDLSMGDQ